MAKEESKEAAGRQRPNAEEPKPAREGNWKRPGARKRGGHTGTRAVWGIDEDDDERTDGRTRREGWGGACVPCPRPAGVARTVAASPTGLALQLPRGS